MRRYLFWALVILTLAAQRLDPFFGGLILAGGFAEHMVAKQRGIW